VKRFMFIAMVVVAALSMSATAFAGNGNGGSPPPTDGGSTGKGVSTTKYKVAYTDVFYGPVSCAGVHQEGKNFGDWGQDSFTCTSTTGNPLRNIAPGQSVSLSTTGGWYSDYYYFVASPSFILFATNLSGTVSDDGYSVTAVANY
jgi:hypothetical protein